MFVDSSLHHLSYLESKQNLWDMFCEKKKKKKLCKQRFKPSESSHRTALNLSMYVNEEVKCDLAFSLRRAKLAKPVYTPHHILY